MRLSLFKKVCLTVMGVGIVSSLVSVGTFATFTATTTNPGNTFAAGTLTLVNTINNPSVGTAGPNIIDFTGGDLAGSQPAGCTSGASATACATAFATSKITTTTAGAAGTAASGATVTSGLEPGQYIQAVITLKNSGTLPALMGLQIENAGSTYCGQTLTQGNETFTAISCPTDVSDDTNISFSSTYKLGHALNVTIQDETTSVTAPNSGNTAGSSTGPTTEQCIYGSSSGGTGVTAQAPVADGSYYKPFTAGTACDTINSAAKLGTGGSVASGGISTAGSSAGVYTAWAFDSNGANALDLVTLGAGANNSHTIYIPGQWYNVAGTAVSAQTATDIREWGPGETHTLTITIAFPNTGTTSYTDTTYGDKYTVGADENFQGGLAGFDIVWLAQQ